MQPAGSPSRMYTLLSPAAAAGRPAAPAARRDSPPAAPPRGAASPPARGAHARAPQSPLPHLIVCLHTRRRSARVGKPIMSTKNYFASLEVEEVAEAPAPAPKKAPAAKAAAPAPAPAAAAPGGGGGGGGGGDDGPARCVTAALLFCFRAAAVCRARRRAFSLSRRFDALFPPSTPPPPFCCALPFPFPSPLPQSRGGCTRRPRRARRSARGLVGAR
jgi:hypothetical protein